MATIRKRNNKYQVQVRRKGFAPIARSFKNKSDADQWSRHMEVKADRGELPTPIKVLDNYKIAELLKRYKDEISIKKLSYDNEKYIIEALIKQPFANLSLAQITSTKFASYRDMRLKTVKAGTIRRELSLLKHLFDIAEREWNIPIRENPLKKLPKITPQAGRNRRLEIGEYEVIEEANRATRNTLTMPIICFALATAMRRDEILRIKWSDINYNNKTLLISVTKNGHARTIPLSTRAITILKGLDNKSKFVFPISVNAFNLSWGRLLKRSGIKDLHFHDLRHEAISRFFELGLSVPEVALISGHRDYRMLFRYTHLKPESLVDKLG